MTSIFGAMIPSSDVEQAILNTLSPWIDTYLAEIERQQTITVGALQRPRSAQTSYDFANWDEGQYPALVCVCPGTYGDVVRNGEGDYSAWFEVRVGVVVEDTTEANARRVSQFHQVAIETILSQRGSLGGFASEMKWINRKTVLPDVANRTLAYSPSEFRVNVDSVVMWQGGPATPNPPSVTPEAPYPAWPTVVSTEVDFTGTRLP
jgi:hypothetical protein